MPEPITTSAVAFVVAHFVAEHSAGHIVGAEAHEFYRRFLERWRKLPMDSQTHLPRNHDVESAGAEALREALFVLVMELAGRIEPNKSWITNWAARLPGGGVLGKDIFPDTKEPYQRWLNGLRAIVAGNGIKSLHQTLKLEEGNLRECFANGNICQALGTGFGQSILDWVRFELAGGAEHPDFEDLVRKGWEVPGTLHRVTIAHAYCLFFREHVKRNPKVFHILVADTLNEIRNEVQLSGDRINVELKSLGEKLDAFSRDDFASLKIQVADFQRWLDPQLGEIKTFLAQTTHKLDAISALQGEILVATMTLNMEVRRGNAIAAAQIEALRVLLVARLDKLPGEIAMRVAAELTPLPFAKQLRLTGDGRQVIQEAERLAREFGFDIVERTHLLLALLDCAGHPSSDLLGRATSNQMRQLAKSLLDRTSPAKTVPTLVWVSESQRVLDRAMRLANSHGSGSVGPVQLWQALVENPGTKTQRVLTESAVKVEAFKQKLIALTEADLQRSSYRF